MQGSGQSKVRALSRNPDKHSDLADEVIEADLNHPETLKAAFEGAHGVFLVTNFREQDTDELKQATATVRAAKRVSNILSGRRCLMQKQSAEASSMSPILRVRPRLIG